MLQKHGVLCMGQLWTWKLFRVSYKLDGFHDMRLTMSLQEDLCRIALHTAFSLPEEFSNRSSMLEGFHDMRVAMRGPLFYLCCIELHKTLKSPWGIFRTNPHCVRAFTIWTSPRVICNMTFLYALHCTQPLVNQRGFENISSILEGFHDISLALRGPL